MKKQTEIINVTGKGICFPVALYNAFPKIFKNEIELKNICTKFNKDDSHDIEFYFDYFNKYISTKPNCRNDELALRKFISKSEFDQFSYNLFLDYLKAHKNNVMIIGLNNYYNKNNYHAVTFTGYDNTKGVIYFENGNNEVLLINLLNGVAKKQPFKPLDKGDLVYIKNEQTIDHKDLKEYLMNKYVFKINEFTCIHPLLLYIYSPEIYFITLTHEDSILKNFTSKLTKTLLPKNAYWVSESEVLEEEKRLDEENPLIEVCHEVIMKS